MCVVGKVWGQCGKGGRCAKVCKSKSKRDGDRRDMGRVVVVVVVCGSVRVADNDAWQAVPAHLFTMSCSTSPPPPLRKLWFRSPPALCCSNRGRRSQRHAQAARRKAAASKVHPRWWWWWWHRCGRQVVWQAGGYGVQAGVQAGKAGKAQAVCPAVQGPVLILSLLLSSKFSFLLFLLLLFWNKPEE